MQPIAESELIINPRGAIYHLDVRPDELAGNIITVGDPDRVRWQPAATRHRVGGVFERQRRLRAAGRRGGSAEPVVQLHDK